MELIVLTSYSTYSMVLQVGTRIYYGINQLFAIEPQITIILKWKNLYIHPM